MGGSKNPIKDIGKNIERNTQNITNSIIGMTRPGGLNNLGQTTYRNWLSAAAPWMNPDQGQDLFGKNNIERQADETQAAMKDQETADAAAAIAEQNRQVSTTIEGLIGGRRGKGAKTPATSLLTYK